MLTLWKSLCLSEHDYCSQLWNPHRTGYIQSLEQLQHSFVKKIHGMSELSYWDQLKALRLYSLERRRERYIIIYTWKMLECLVPNISEGSAALRSKWHPRRGRECSGPNVSSNASCRIQSVRRASFAVNGPCLFSSLPKNIRDTTGCDTSAFKSRLDCFLASVPDQPLIPGYTAYRQCESNSLYDWLRSAQWKSLLEGSSRQTSLQNQPAATDHGDPSQ